jgi:hypothetical protein
LDVRVLQEELADSHQRQWDLLQDYLESYAEHRPVRSVAVIGNKPLEPDAQRAAAIDASDLVRRVNSFQLDEPGEPPTLGTACHVALISRRVRTTKWVFQDYRRRGYLVPQMGFPLLRGVRLNPLFWPPDLGAMPLPNGVVMKRLADRLDPGHAPGRLIPTSGTTLAYLAHEMFPGAAMLATGFSFMTLTEQTEWAHHSGGTTAVHEYHDLSLEAELLRSWVADGSIRFYD